VDGAASTIETLGESLRGLSEQHGIVWYYREPSKQDIPPIAMEAMKLVANFHLPIRLSSRPDYSDAVGGELGIPTLDASFQKAIESDLLHTRAFLRTLRALDAGEATKARKIAIIPVLMDLDFAQYYFTRGLASPTPEQTEQWAKVASETLDYMLKHRDEWDPRRVDVQGGIRGLRYFLTTPEDVRRLDELSGQLVENKKKALEKPNP